MSRLSPSSTCHLAVVIAAVSMTACVEAEVDAGDEVDTEAVSKIGQNSLPENWLAAFAPEMNLIVRKKLGDEPLIVDVGKDPKGHVLLDYTLRCALGSSQKFEVKNPQGVVVPLPNLAGIGLAPGWLTRGLTQVEQQWVMGCILAHINAAGRAVQVSFRGPHSALATTAAEAAAHPYLEGAFYGDFGDPNNPDLAFRTRQYACYGPALVAKCGAAAPTVLWKRLCTLGDCSDLTVVGPCEAKAPSTNRACGSRNANYFKDCASRATTGAWPAAGADRYSPVVTTWLKEVDCSAGT
jgi:hypothetical protein